MVIGFFEIRCCLMFIDLIVLIVLGNIVYDFLLFVIYVMCLEFLFFGFEKYLKFKYW